MRFVAQLAAVTDMDVSKGRETALEIKSTAPISVGPISSSFSCYQQPLEESCLELRARPAADNNDLAETCQFGGVVVPCCGDEEWWMAIATKASRATMGINELRKHRAKK